MGSTFKYPPRPWSGESGDNPSFDEDRLTYSIAAEDMLDDPEIVDGPDAGGVYRPAPRRSSWVRLPSVDEFDLDEACRAKSLAHRFGPQTRDGGSERDRWSYAEQDGRDEAAWREPSQRRAASAGRRRGFFWGFGTAIFVIVGVPVVLGIVQPASDRPPAPVGVIGGDLDHGPHPLAGVEAADASDPAETIAIPSRPATAAIAAPMPNALAASVEPESPPVTTADLDASGGGAPGSTDDDALVATPPSEATARPRGGAEDFVRMAQSQLSVSADPYEMEGSTGAVPDTLLSDETVSPLSPEQINQLLGRGEELLRNGQIASARLVFLRIAAAGDPRGAKAAGMTYDPEVYARLPVTGLAPDREQAEVWYDKAGEAAYTIDLTAPVAVETHAADAQESALQEWNAACARKYHSFDPETGHYAARSGTKRRCQLP
jgi:hypothetical protein